MKVGTFTLLFALLLALAGCGGGGSGVSFAISVTPADAIVHAGRTQQFRASVTGMHDRTVTWSVEGGATNGTIDANGLYTAPAITGRYLVIATSNEDPSRNAIATVQVVASVSVSVSGPAGGGVTTADVPVGGSLQLSAQVNGSANQDVIWRVLGGDTNGTVSATGLYTPPRRTGVFTISATPRADTTKSASFNAVVLGNVRMTIAGKGDLIIQMRRDLAPQTVDNFTKLVSEGFYDGIRFHRFGPDDSSPIEIIQAGDPNSRTLPIDDPSLGTYRGTQIAFEGGGPPHTEGVISMASTERRTGGSTQFFFCRAATPFLDGDYASFGQVISGNVMLLTLRRGDTIERAEVIAP